MIDDYWSPSFTIKETKMELIKIEKRLDELSVFNVACFIIWNIGIWTDKKILLFIPALCALVSLFINIYIAFTIKEKTETAFKLRKRNINQIVFCIFFIIAVIIATPLF